MNNVQIDSYHTYASTCAIFLNNNKSLSLKFQWSKIPENVIVRACNSS